MMKRFSCARNGHGEAADVEEPEIRIGWRQEWTSPERLEENGSVRIRDVVRGPFQTPRLLKARPFFAASTKNEGIGAISDRKQTLRRGIPDTWSEYLAIQGHCDTRDTKFLQENGIPCCTRCHVTDIIWKRLGVPLTQGIPDPSRVLPLFRSKSKERISDPCVNKEAEGNIDRPTFVPCNRGRDKKVHPVKNRRRKSGNMRRNERDDKLNGSNVEYDKTKKHGYKGFRRYKERDDKLDTSSQADHKQGVGRRLNGDSNKNCYTVKSSASHSRSFGGFEKRKGSPPGSSHIDEPEGNKARQVRITDVQYIEEPTTSEESKKNSTRLVSIGHKGAKNGTGVQVPGPRRRRIRSRRCRQRSINDKRNDSKANHGRSYEKGGGPKAKETQVQGEDRSASQGGKSGDSKCKDDEKRVVDRTVDRISFEAERDRRMASFSDIEKSREENTCRVCRSCKRIAEKSTMERKYHDTIGCGCALRISQSFVPGKDCISKRVNQFEGCDTSNLVLCEACEDIYHKDHSWKSFPDLRNAERPVGLAKNSRSRATSNRHEELYEKTKRKICFCVERAKRIILSSNFLGGEKERSGKKVRLEPRSEARAMRETSFVCCRCDCPYLKVAFDHHANREFSNTLESLGRDKPKKKQKLLGSKHGNLKDTALQRVEKFDGALNSEKRVCTRTGNKICVSAHIDERFSCSNNVTSVHASKPRKKRASEGKTRHETVNSSIHLPTPRLTVNTNDYSDANRRNKIHNLAQVNHKEFSSKRMSSRDKQFHLIPKDSFKDNSRNFVGNKTTNKGQDCSYTDSENCTRVHVENKLNASTYVNGSFIGLKELFEEEKAKRMTTVRKNNKRYIPPCNSKKTIQTDTDRFAGNHDVYSRTSSGHGVIFRTKEDNRAIFSETTRRINHEKENVGKIGDHCSKLKGETREKKKETEYARRVKSNNPEESPSDSGERADISDFSDDLKVNIATTGERSSAIVKTLVKRLNAKLALRGNDRGPNEHRCAVSRKSTSQRCKSNSDDDEGSLTPENYECPKLFLNRSMVGELCESAAATDRKEYEKLSIEAFHGLSGSVSDDTSRSKKEPVDLKFHERGVNDLESIRSMHTADTEGCKEALGNSAHLFLDDGSPSKKGNGTSGPHDRHVAKQESISSMQKERLRDEQEVLDILSDFLLDDGSWNKNKTIGPRKHNRRDKQSENIRSTDKKEIEDNGDILDVSFGSFFDDGPRNNKNSDSFLSRHPRGEKPESTRFTNREEIENDRELFEVLSSPFSDDRPRNRKKAGGSGEHNPQVNASESTRMYRGGTENDKDSLDKSHDLQLVSIMNHAESEKKGGHEGLYSETNKGKKMSGASDSHKRLSRSSLKIADLRRTRSPCIFSRDARNVGKLFMHNENVESSSALTNVELREVEFFTENHKVVGTDVKNDDSALDESKMDILPGNDVIEENIDHPSVVSVLFPNHRPISIGDHRFEDKEIIEAWTDIKVTKEKPYLDKGNVPSDLENLRSFLIGESEEKGSMIGRKGFNKETCKRSVLSKNNYLSTVK